MSSDTLAGYYARRAHEYEHVYAKPERQQDLRWLARRLGALLADRDVLEVACGTGYWTQVLADHAHSVLACDINQEVLAIARAKPWSAAANVTFRRHDAFDVADVPGRFDAGFAGFWWSHVERGRLTGFLSQWHKRVGRGGLVVAIDNRYVPGSSTSIVGTDTKGNTYQLRRLADGSHHEVLKNFPDANQLLADLAQLQPPIVEAKVELTRYFWCLHYRLAG